MVRADGVCERPAAAEVAVRNRSVKIRASGCPILVRKHDRFRDSGHLDGDAVKRASLHR
jgi:hypothetical protein